MELLVNKELDSRDIHVLVSLYSQQTAAVNVEGQIKEDIEMRRDEEEYDKGIYSCHYFSV